MAPPLQRRRMNAALTSALSTSPLRAAISASTRTPEPQLLPGLIEQARLPDAQAQAAAPAQQDN